LQTDERLIPKNSIFMRKLFFFSFLVSFLYLSQCLTQCRPVNCDEIAIDTTMVVDSLRISNPVDGNLYFNGFPSLTMTGGGKYILGYQKGNGDAFCCGVPVIRTSMNPRNGWSDSTVMETDSTDNYRDCQVSAYGDTVYMTYFNENLTDRSHFGQVFFRISTNAGITWSERTQVSAQVGQVVDRIHDTLATEGKLVKFKNKLIVPVYAIYLGNCGPAGFVISNSLDTWRTDTAVWISQPPLSTAGLTECNMITIGDSLIAFFRGNGNFTFYRSASYDGITWTPVVDVTPPYYFGAKPALYKMPDGRIVLNYRSSELGNYGQIGVSCNNGLSFKYSYMLEPTFEFYYGDIAKGANNFECVNVYSIWTGALTGNPGIATLYCSIYKIPRY
jgi:BNR repeat-like domain